MHGNSEMQKINQTSAMPEKTDVHWSGRFSVAPMLDRMYRFEKQVVIHFVGAYWEPGVFISRCNPCRASE